MDLFYDINSINFEFLTILCIAKIIKNEFNFNTPVNFFAFFVLFLFLYFAFSEKKFFFFISFYKIIYNTQAANTVYLDQKNNYVQLNLKSYKIQ